MTNLSVEGSIPGKCDECRCGGTLLGFLLSLAGFTEWATIMLSRISKLILVEDLKSVP